MKRTCILVACALLAAAAYAQPAPPPQPSPSAAVILQGALSLGDKHPAIRMPDGKLVYLMMPEFEKYASQGGFKDGMPVSVKGMEMPPPPGSGGGEGQSVLMVMELTINGKTYMSQPPQGQPPMGPPPSGSNPASH